MGYAGMEHQTYVQFEREATWGTKPTITHALAATRVHARPLIGKAKARNLTGKISPAAITALGEMALVTLEFDICYTGQLLWWDALMGTATYGSNGGATSGANPYTHVFREENYHNSLSLEVIRGNIPDGKCELITGAKIDKANLVWVASLDGDEAKGHASIEMIARRFQTDQTPASAIAQPSYDPVIFGHASTVEDGTSDTDAEIVLRRFEFSYDNKLARDFGMNSAVGKYLVEPIRNDRPEAVFKMVSEFRSKSAMDLYIANTEANPKMYFASSSKEFRLEMAKAYMMTHEKPPTDGKIMQEFEWHPIDDGAGSSNNTGVSLTVINAQSAITA